MAAKPANLGLPEYASRNETHAELGNLGAEPNPPLTGSAICSRFTAASSSARSETGADRAAARARPAVNLPAALRTSDGFSFHACASRRSTLPKPGRPYESEEG